MAYGACVFYSGKLCPDRDQMLVVVVVCSWRFVCCCLWLPLSLPLPPSPKLLATAPGRARVWRLATV